MRTTREQANLSTIRFEARLFKISSWTLLQLPSRGMTMVEGTSELEDLTGFIVA